MKGDAFGYEFKSTDELLEFLYKYCTAEERRELKIRIGKSIMGWED